MTSPPASRDLRTALLDAAEIEIGERGAAGASLRAVARRAGASHQAPAHFFENRRGLLTALATRTLDRLADQFEEEERAQAAAAPMDRLIGLGMVYVDFAMTHPGLFTLSSNPDQIDTGDPQLAAARERSWSVLRAMVHDAQQTGWRADLPTDSVALGCWSLVHGTAALWSGGWLRAQFPEGAMRERVRDMLWHTL